MSLKAIFNAMKKKDSYITKDLDLYLLSLAQKDNDRAIDVNAPSAIGGCLRARYYGRVGVEKDMNGDARQQRIYDNGSYVHMRLQKYLLDCGILLMDEVPVVNNACNIQGHTDGLIKISDNELAIVEIKSIKQENYKDLKDAQDKHKEQGLSYAYCVEERRKFIQEKFKTLSSFQHSLPLRMGSYAKLYQHLKGGKKFTREQKIAYQCRLHAKLDELLYNITTPITKVIFLYENKNTQEIKEYVISTTDPEMQEIMTNIILECTYLNECVKDDEVPARSGKCKSDNVCRWCDFKLACWN